ncbi:hypothetical protein [Mesomycoplasma ovipneumoniae]|uniref:hypothetical protein n=1 Tax=Mesomycoplasma ovipneumoniae TaxID=29562 RepID=UPI0026E1DAAC|nr:hypothetical protein [Mesomycoplasma ovipneumoniae]MDO6829457.1 hypothetical protein [Mesomycoplasma ovipneumoniae]
MKEIVKLEIQNLTEQEKKELHNFFKSREPQRISYVEEQIKFIKDVYGTSEKHNILDETLKNYFKTWPEDFIDFQKSHENSLYNQALKQHGFKNSNFEDVVNNLTPKQKDQIINDISRKAENFWPTNTEYYSHYWDPSGAKPYIRKITLKDHNNFKKIEKRKVHWTEKQFLNGFGSKSPMYFENTWYHHLIEELDNYKNSEYVLVKPYDHAIADQTELKFFKTADEVILFGLNEPTIKNPLLRWNEKYLNPHHKVNQWIVKNHELERLKKDSQEQKDSLEQNQKFEAPKMKM